ncbi:MAG TPA: TetR/AcrR family transcriptional regulator [Chitinophagaceae bacterium]|nr:TetR/AcrR family transcriptional regulator [Chitinophagaceae bacterium]
MSKAEKTRAYILEKTAPIFNTKGYAGTSLTDMTDATGLTKGSIYGNFENKDEVALAAFDFNLRKVRSIISTEMEKRATVKEKLLVYVDVYENFMNYPFPAGGCPILNTAVEADDTHPALKKKAADAIAAWRDSITGLIETGIKTGEFKKTLNAENAALTVIAMIEGGVMISKLTGKQDYRKAVMQSVGDYIKNLV